MDVLIQSRLVVYDFLRRVFLHEPTEEFFGRLSESDLLNELIDLPGVSDMRSSLQEVQASGEIDPIRQDFFQLFLGPRRLKAPPWESVYVSEDRLVNQAATVEVRRSYAKFGFQTEGGQLEDHCGTQCDFLFRLCAMTMGAEDVEEQKDLLRAQKHFVSKHLLNWVPRFAEDIRKSALTPYFRGLGEFVNYWIRVEEEYLSSVV